MWCSCQVHPWEKRTSDRFPRARQRFSTNVVSMWDLMTVWFHVFGFFFRVKKFWFFPLLQWQSFFLRCGKPAKAGCQEAVLAEGLYAGRKTKELKNCRLQGRCYLGFWNWWQSWVGLELNHWMCWECLWPKQRQKQMLGLRRGLVMQLVMFFCKYRGNWEVPWCSVGCVHWKRQ